MKNVSSAIIAILCIAIFLAGLYCYSLAFQMSTETMSALVFILGVALNTLAFFIPWQIVGHGRK